MIPDQLFKALAHSSEGYKMCFNGQSLEDGYRPDYVLKRGNDYIILESENTSSRKTFVGGLVKAAHFLQGQNTGSLVFVIVPRKNTSVSAIAKHLKRYLVWLSAMTNLRDVYVIEARLYYAPDVLAALDSKEFLASAIKV